MSTLAQLEAELAERQDDLNTCNDMLALDPESADALEMIPVLKDSIADLKSRIAALKTQDSIPPPPAADDDVPPPPPKYDMSKHPKFRRASPEAPPPPPAEEVQTVFNVKDVVMARYSADKQWYQATIVSKTGSSADPVYKVLFKGYDDQETKRKHEVRAIVEPPSKKRKADGAPATSAPQGSAPHVSKPPKTQQNGMVISAAPAVNTAVLPPKREPSKVSDGPTRLAPEPKKLKGSRVLEKGKNNWQDFQKQGPKKGAGGFGQSKKESMFRTADLPGAKVGFTGSGKGMQKDQKRTTWKFSGPTED